MPLPRPAGSSGPLALKAETLKIPARARDRRKDAGFIVSLDFMFVWIDSYYRGQKYVKPYPVDLVIFA